MLFELIAHRYERHSLIITSNQTFEDWDKLFDDTIMTVAAIDRLIHHATITQCEGGSYRRKTTMQNQQYKTQRQLDKIIVAEPDKVIDALQMSVYACSR